MDTAHLIRGRIPANQLSFPAICRTCLCGIIPAYGH